jgi:hypothetical protein
MCDIWLLRLRALLARAHDDAAAYADFRDRYRDMATSLGFRGAYRVGRGNAMTAVVLYCSILASAITAVLDGPPNC